MYPYGAQPAYPAPPPYPYPAPSAAPYPVQPSASWQQQAAGRSPPTPQQSACMHGPFLRFGGYEPSTCLYRASVLVVVQEQENGNGSWAAEAPSLSLMYSGTQLSAPAVFLHRHRAACFWRFDLSLTAGPDAQVIEYTVMHRTAYPYSKRAKFSVPGANQAWRWGFFSCNGFDKPEDSVSMGGVQPLWRDVMSSHTNPMHVMLGGGDQLYNDGVWEVPSMVEWLAVSKSQRVHLPFTQTMQAEVEDFYYQNYLKNWLEPVFTDALASIPQVMVWDDHDVFDGWGSYPAKLQLSPIFQSIFIQARLFYCLFQQHSTPELIHQQNQVFGEYGYNWLSCLGSSTAILLIDSRMERSRDFIVRPASWALIQTRLSELPVSVKHVVVVATVPMIYPQIPVAESSMVYLTGKGFGSKLLKAFVNGSGLASVINSSFGEPELLDDLLDHWSAEIHRGEKLAVLHMLQEIALRRGFRFTLLSGDVHVAGVGRFCSNPPLHPTPTQLCSDHRFMYQIISSAIANKPPPDAVISALNMSASPEMLDKHTREKMLSVFQDRFSTCRLRASRNWCLVNEQADGSLNFQLRLELGVNSGTLELVEVVVPKLKLLTPSTAPLRPFELLQCSPPAVGSSLQSLPRAPPLAPSALPPAALPSTGSSFSQWHPGMYGPNAPAPAYNPRQGRDQALGTTSVTLPGYSQVPPSPWYNLGGAATMPQRQARPSDPGPGLEQPSSPLHSFRPSLDGEGQSRDVRLMESMQLMSLHQPQAQPQAQAQHQQHLAPLPEGQSVAPAVAPQPSLSAYPVIPSQSAPM